MTPKKSAKKVASSPRKKPTQARSRVMVDAMLEATVTLLVEQGYDTVTTNQVARRAGVSIGSLYQYFPSKEALAGELMDRYAARMRNLFSDVFAKAGTLPPKELVRELVHALARTKAENPALAKVLRDHVPRLDRAKNVDANLEFTTNAVAVYLAHHKDRLRVKSPERAAFFAVELADHMVSAAIMKRSEAVDVVVDEITDIVVRYLFSV